jgi:K+-sensing histidine kinase KdpD
LALADRTVATEWETGRPLELAVEPMVSQVDPAKVERIVENLLANADRHTTPDTPVWVKLARQDQGVLIAVEDAGSGVPPELRQRCSSVPPGTGDPDPRTRGRHRPHTGGPLR